MTSYITFVTEISFSPTCPEWGCVILITANVGENTQLITHRTILGIFLHTLPGNPNKSLTIYKCNTITMEKQDMAMYL